MDGKNRVDRIVKRLLNATKDKKLWRIMIAHNLKEPDTEKDNDSNQNPMSFQGDSKIIPKSFKIKIRHFCNKIAFEE